MKQKIIFFIVILTLGLSVTGKTLALESIPVNIALESVATNLSNPLFVTHAGDGSGRLFIVQNDGKILIYKNGAVNTTPFLSMSGSILTSGDERGLLGLAFAPNYETSGKFYVYYNNAAGDVEIARYSVSNSNADLADSSSREILLTIAKPYENHNGGMLAFGADGYLYAGIGDGGSGGDPHGNGQNINALLGKILRLDVSGDDFPADPDKNYAIPPSNPFVGVSGSDEIWAYGLRNPWRFSFDKNTNDLYIGDVGQGQREEIDFQAATSAGGENYGWNEMEGSICYTSGCNLTGKILPVAEYTHAAGCSVTGGYIYRGAEFSALQGVYLYADFCEGKLFGLIKNADGQWQSKLIRDTPYKISSFGESENGELYITDYATNSVYKIVEAPMMNKTYTSQPTRDGYIIETSEHSGTGGGINASSSFLRIGDNRQNRQYRSILSFNTGASLPDDAEITNVTLKIKQNKIGGADNPMSALRGLMVAFKMGAFGSSALESSDFQIVASKNIGPLSPTLSAGWYNIDLSKAVAYINKLSTGAGLTQIRLRFKLDDNNNHIANFIEIFSGNAAQSTDRPILVIDYYLP